MLLKYLYLKLDFIPVLLLSIQSYCYVFDYNDYDDYGNLKNSSTKLCPDTQAYFNETRKCYDYHSKGPCGDLMVFDRVLDHKMFGECTCKQIPQGGCTTRPTVYWPDNNRCYYIYDQGPCPEGFWLVQAQSNQDSAKCEIIPCLDEYNEQSKPVDSIDVDPDSKFVFLSGNKCFTSATPGQSLCPPDKEAYFLIDGGFEHTCVERGRMGCPPIVTLSGPNECSNGRLPDLNGSCEPDASLDYQV